MHAKQVIEAALFVSSEPLSVDKLAEVSGKTRDEVRAIVEELRRDYANRDSAIEIRSIGDDHYLMQAKEALSGMLIELVKPAVAQETLKTLSLIALRQPITQAEVVKARGSAAYAHIRELIAKGFVFASPAGRTKMLTTTEKFSDYFGFSRDIAEVKKQIGELLMKR
jgi:segregation and condensation protein B